MKKLIPIIILLFVFCVFCTKKDNNTNNVEKKDVEPKKEEVKKVEDPLEILSKEMKSLAKEGVEIPEAKLEEIKKKVTAFFPKTEGDFAGFTWDISVSKNKDDKDIFFAADLYRKKDDGKEKVMWFHILYDSSKTKEEKDGYGDYNFEGYKGSVNEDSFLWILVNNVEIRANADIDDFKKTDKIKSVLKAFDLKSLEKL